MPAYQRTFRGHLDLDNNAYRVGELNYIDALNITRDNQGDGQDDSLSNIIGNVLVNYDLPEGANKCIGKKEDLIRNRIYYFIWNQFGNHLILYYNENSQTIVKIFQNKTNTYKNQDILKFNPSYRINHIDIIYRNEGDLLYWTDGLNSPRCIDITYILTIVGGNDIRLTDIQMAKQPPSIPPFCWYEDDNSVTVNNLRKNLFKFKLRYLYEDLTKSTTSSQGALPLPVTELVLTDPPSKNAKIAIALTTGERNVTKIEILAAHNLGSNTFSDYFLIKSIDKDALGLADNDVYVYEFFNNEAYNNIDVTESVQQFDLVPLIANTQASANGNTIEYANIKEGYDNPNTYNSEVDVTDYVTLQAYQTGNIYAYQNGDSVNDLSDYTITIIGLGTSFNRGTTTTIQTTNNTISYTSLSSESRTSYLSNLQSVANSLGYTTSTPNSHTLLITKVGELLLDFTINTINEENIGALSSMPCYDWFTRYSFGLVFFDAKGITNGVVYPMNNTIQSNNYELEHLTSPVSYYVPKLIKVSNIMDMEVPNWAYSYQIVRAKRLNKGYFVQWISEITFKETNVGSLNQSYAYIGINSLDAFISENPASSFLGYSFQSKDRIRFIANGIQTDGSATNIYTDKDFEILDYVANPIVNGITYTGKYIKIALPTTDSTFNFGTTNFYNYFLEVYKPTTPVGNGLNVYYEFGQMFKCTPSETLNITHKHFQGDCYSRYRTINTAPKLQWASNTATYYDLNNSNDPFDYSTLALNRSSKNVDFGIITSYDEAASHANPTTEKIIEIQNDGLTHTFNVTLDVTLGAVVAHYGLFAFDFNIKFMDSNNAVLLQTPLIAPPTIYPIGGTSYSSGVVSVTSPVGTARACIGAKASFIPAIDNYYVTFTINKATVTLQEQGKAITQYCIDPNFSDFYQSDVNSNGREWIHDVNAKQQWFPANIRFSQAYQQDTNINKTNRFYAENFYEYDRANGSIQKLFVDGRRLYVFQQFDIGIVPILQQIVSDTSGNPLQAQSDTLLNKIQYPYQAKVGIGNVPESFAYNMNTIFGVDNNRGIVWSLSLNGINEISTVYNIDAFISRITPAYNINLNNGYAATGQPYLGNPTIQGGFDYYTSRYWCAFEQIDRYDSEGTLLFHQEPYTLTFADTKDDTRGFESFMSWYPEAFCSLGTLLVSFQNGKLYTHNSDLYCNFGGQQFEAYITTIFNGTPQIKKTFMSIEQLSDTIWDTPFIETSSNSYNNIKQVSYLNESDYQAFESAFATSFLRDANSIGGLLGGDFLKGNYIKLKMRLKDTKSMDYHYLNLVQIKANESRVNIK